MTEETVKSSGGSFLTFDKEYWPKVTDESIFKLTDVGAAISGGEKKFWDIFSIQMAETLINSDRPRIGLYSGRGKTVIDCYLFECGGDSIHCSVSLPELINEALEDVESSFGYDEWQAKSMQFRDELLAAADRISALIAEKAH